MNKALRSGEDGYTLTEMLAALLIIGLTTAGLMEGGYAISRLQTTSARRVQAFTSTRLAQTRFAGLLEDRGPFRSSGAFEGGGDAFSFPCAGGACGASLKASGDETTLQLRIPASFLLPLGHSQALRFAYIGSGPLEDAWPPSHGEPQRLRTILLLAGGVGHEHAVASAPVWRQEEAGCRFDAIVKDCRTGPS